MAGFMQVLTSFIAITYNGCRRELGLQFNCKHTAIELAESISDRQLSDDVVFVAWRQFMEDWCSARDFGESISIVEQAFDTHRPQMKELCFGVDDVGPCQHPGPDVTSPDDGRE